MIKQQELYEAFLTRVEPEHRAFAAELHELFVNNGCTVEIKPTSSGFLVSYKFASTKKAVAILCFAKAGSCFASTPTRQQRRSAPERSAGGFARRNPESAGLQASDALRRLQPQVRGGV